MQTKNQAERRNMRYVRTYVYGVMLVPRISPTRVGRFLREGSVSGRGYAYDTVLIDVLPR